MSEVKMIAPSELQGILAQYLDEYSDEAKAAADEAIQKVAKQTTKDLKKAGSFGGNEFRKGWKSETEKSRVGVTSVTVGNADKPGLVHLLEFGHAKQNGGRTTAFNFVAPINDMVEQRFIEALEEALK